ERVVADREIRSVGRQAATVSDLLWPRGIADVIGLPDEQRVDDARRITRGAGRARRVSEADRVVGQLQIRVQVQLAAAPDRAVAILVAGEILEVRDDDLAARIGRVRVADEVRTEI